MYREALIQSKCKIQFINTTVCVHLKGVELSVQSFLLHIAGTPGLQRAEESVCSLPRRRRRKQCWEGSLWAAGTGCVSEAGVDHRYFTILYPGA